MNLPLIAPIRQKLSAGHIEDVPAHVRRTLHEMPLSSHICAGMRVAVAVGSRGIGCIGDVVTALVLELQELGAEPYLVPAMGSHGGGTAEGQRDVLISYGLGPERLAIPIRSDMETVQVGTAPNGMPVYFDANTADADAIIIVNRIKPHTAFRARWESGLFKILAVGLGKRQGAETLHTWGIGSAIPLAARTILQNMPVVAGIAIVENGYHQPATICALAAELIEEEEPLLLEEAWRHLPRLPFSQLDMLVLGEIGKDISGTGMDLNVVGMWRRSGGAVDPDYRLISALDLTANSHGNAVGVGYCDLIPQRLRDKIDLSATYTNCLTARNYNGAKLPITLPADRDLFEAGLPSYRTAESRLVLVRNTLDLDTLWVSAALLPEVHDSPGLTQIGPPQPLPFDAAGNLALFSHADSESADPHW